MTLHRKSYTLDEKSRRDFHAVVRAIKTKPTEQFDTSGLTAPDRLYARITSNIGDGEYAAEQVEWESGYWVTTDGGVIWGSATGGPGYLHHINSVDDISVDTVVEAIAWGDTDQSTVWIFTLIDSGAGHPWKCRIVTDSTNAIIETAYLTPDYQDSVTIYDELTNVQNEITATNAPYTVDVSAITGDGIAYIVVEYDGSSGWVIRDEATFPFQAIAVASWPPNEERENIDVYYIPLCRFTDQGTSDFSINQLMYVNPWFAVRKFVNPFRGRVYDSSGSDQIEIGYLRNNGNYDLHDHIIVMDEEGDFEKISDNTSHISNNLTGSGYLWYEIIQNSSDTWSLRDNGGTPIFSGTAFPPASEDMAVIYLLLGEYVDAGGDNFKWFQTLKNNPVVTTRQFSHGFFPQYYDNAGTDSVQIADGEVAIGSTTQTVTGSTYSLSTTTYIYVVVTINKQDQSVTITSSLQDAATAPTEWDDTDETAIVWNILIGTISGGKYHQNTMGDIYHPDLFFAAFQHPFQAKIQDGTTNIIDVGYRRGDADYQFKDGFVIYDESGDFQFLTDSTLRSSPSLSVIGTGYLWYELYQDDTTGTWAMADNSGTPIFAGASFPPSQDYGYVYVLIGYFSGAGTSDFTWGQILNDNSEVHTRSVDKEFQPIYTVDTGTSSVQITGGSIYGQLFSQAVSAHTYSLTTDVYIWVEVVSAPNTVPTANAALQSGATFPGHVTVGGGSLTTRYLIGFISSGTYFAVHTGSIFAGTLWQPEVHIDIDFGDQQGVQLLGRDNVTNDIAGAGTSNSYFYEGRQWDVHFQGGQIDNEDTGATVKWGGTSDNITNQSVVSSITSSASAITIGSRNVTHELTTGLSTKNEWTSQTTTDITFQQITVVTDMQVSGTTLQKKTRTCYVLSAGAESAWTTWHTGNSCP